MILIIIILFLLILLLYPFSFIMKAYVNPIKNKNFVYIKIGLIPLVCSLIEYKNSRFIKTNKKGLSKEVKIQIPSKFQEYFLVYLSQHIYLDKLLMIFKGGIKNDAYKTALMCGAMSSLFAVSKNYLKCRFDAVINYKIGTNYREDNFTIATDLKIKITIWAVLFALLQSFFKLRRIQNGKRKKSYSKYSS